MAGTEGLPKTGTENLVTTGTLYTVLGGMTTLLIIAFGALYQVLHQADKWQDDRMNRIARQTRAEVTEATARVHRMETLVLERALEHLIRQQTEEVLPEVLEDALEQQQPFEAYED